MINLATRHTVSIFLFIVLSVRSDAAEFEYEIRVGAGRSDNVTLTETDKIEEDIALLGLRMDLQHESKRVELNLITDLEYRNYLDDTFDDETVGALIADLFLQLVPDVFSWAFENRFGNLDTNPFLADTPANRENVNNFSTGPDLRLRLGTVTAIEISGRYRWNNFETSDIDNEVQSGRLSLVRALSPNRTISLNATADDIEFDNTILNDDYERLTAFIGFDSEISNGTLSVKAGLNELRYENAEDTDGDLYDLSWTRNLSASTTFKLSYSQGLTDASDSLLGTQAQGPGFSEPQQTAGVSDPFENKNISAGFDYQRNNNSFFVGARYNEDDYVTASALDRDRMEFRIGFARSIGSAWRFRLDGTLQQTDFVESSREDDDTFLRAGLSRQISRAFSLNIDYTRRERDSNVAGADFVENAIYLTFSIAR